LNTNKNLTFLKRLKFALSGIRFSFLNEKSFRTHSLLSCSLLVLSLVIRPNLLWCALFSLCVGNVMALELFNSALESLCDFTTEERDPKIKIAKDCAAGAVLLSSIASVVVFIFFLFSLRNH
jgi:diacylglycerol kinase